MLVEHSGDPARPEDRPRFLDRTTPPHIFTLVVLSGIGALSLNIFLPSLPGMASYFAADYAVVQLAVSAYLGATAVLQLVIGPLSDRYGRRNIMIGCLLVFILATLICLLAPTIEVFLAGRMLQSVVSAGFVLTRAAVRDMVAEDEAASMIGYVTMGMALVPMVSPALGGFLDQIFGWQSSFVVMLIYGVFAVLLTFADMGETNTRRSSSFLEQFNAYPELATSRRFWGYTLSAALASGAFFAFLGGGPYVGTVILGMSPSELGIYFFFIAIGYMLGNFASGRYAKAVGINRMMLLGQVWAVGGVVLSLGLFLAGFHHPLSFFGPIFFIGVGNGLTLPSANAGIVSVRPQLAGSASGFGGATLIGGGAAVSVLAGILLGPDTGPYPVLLLMLVTSVAGIFASAYVIHVANLVRLEGEQA